MTMSSEARISTKYRPRAVHSIFHNAIPKLHSQDIYFHLQTTGEFHHFIGLDFIKAINTSNTITNRKNSAGFFQLSFSWCSNYSFFKYWRNFSSTLNRFDTVNSSCWDRLKVINHITTSNIPGPAKHLLVVLRCLIPGLTLLTQP